jgi:hypothetical protein
MSDIDDAPVDNNRNNNDDEATVAPLRRPSKPRARLTTDKYTVSTSYPLISKTVRSRRSDGALPGRSKTTVPRQGIRGTSCRSPVADVAQTEDLQKLVRFYQSWARTVFPNLRFADFVQRAQKLCRERRMRVHLQGLKTGVHSVLSGHTVNGTFCLLFYM